MKRVNAYECTTLTPTLIQHADAPIYTDAQGNTYRVSSGLADTVPDGAVTPDDDTPIAPAEVGGSGQFVGDDPHSILEALGLARVEATSVNMSSAALLERFDGISAVRASAIIEGRPWAALEDIASISGISAEMVEAWAAQGLVL